MANLIRLTYVSRATFDIRSESGELAPQLADILTQARRNNQESKISGALFFGEGYFFQCLEGKASLVLPLVERIKRDVRHEDFKISFQRNVRRRYFSTWSMKYVPVTPEIMRLMKSRGYPQFDPVSFQESDINEIFEIFTQVEDSSLLNERLREYSALIKPWWQRLGERLAPSLIGSHGS